MSVVEERNEALFLLDPMSKLRKQQIHSKLIFEGNPTTTKPRTPNLCFETPRMRRHCNWERKCRTRANLCDGTACHCRRLDHPWRFLAPHITGVAMLVVNWKKAGCRRMMDRKTIDEATMMKEWTRECPTMQRRGMQWLQRRCHFTMPAAGLRGASAEREGKVKFLERSRQVRVKLRRRHPLLTFQPPPTDSR